MFAAAERGSRIARSVIADGGRSLAALVVRLAERGVAVDDVVVAGSTVLSQPALYTSFTTSLTEYLPGARPRPLRAAPVEGAVALAHALI